MNKNIFRRMIMLVLALVMLVGSVPMPASAANNEGMTVKVTEDKVVIHIEKVGTTGTAQLYCYDADSYYSPDELKGLSTRKDDGFRVGEYTLGTTKDFTIDRYDANGKDLLFSKFYLIRNNAALRGPVYATEIASKRSVKPFAMSTIKGLTLEDETTIEAAKDLGASNTVINVDLCSLILSNEDANGNPIDRSGQAGVIPFVSNGKTFYFNEGYVNDQRRMISAYSKEGMNVILILIAWVKTYQSSYPSSLMYMAKPQDNKYTMGFNTSNRLGAEYWIAAMEFMANEYSQDAEKGLVHKYVIGNEIDLAKDWNLMQPSFDANGNHQRLPIDTYMEEYTRTLRLANLAVKKYNSEAKVLVSMSQGWAEDFYTACNESGNSERYNTYAVKDLLDWISKHEKARGDYDWALALHPYPVEFRSTVKPTKTDATQKGEPGKGSPITGDVNTTPWVTPSNLEIYQLYLEQPQNLYNGKVRSVSLTESGLRNYDKNKEGITAEIYNESLRAQAASIAQFYYRAAMLTCVEEFAYFQLHDREDSMMKIGLMDEEGNRKPSYQVWKYIDTNEGARYANAYLDAITDKASYKEMMAVVKSDFDWNAKWDESRITGSNPAVVKPVERLAGADRFETSYMVADKLKEVLGVEKFSTVVVASGKDFADALAGSYLAAMKNAPILLSYKDKQNQQVVEYVRENVAQDGTVYILGGPAAVPENLEKNLTDLGVSVKRLAGANRFGTNIEILKEVGVKAGQEILVCTGTDFADSLSASASGLPILLVYNKKGVLMDEQVAYLNTLAGNGNTYRVIGGSSAISDKLMGEVGTYGTTKRLAGANRYETTIEVARTYFKTSDYMVMAYGRNFPDGLCGGPLAYAMGAPLILTQTKYKDNALSYAFEGGYKGASVLGGTGLISDAAVRAILVMAGSEPIALR